MLPFRSSSGSADAASLADGIGEEIITGLSRFSYLHVIGRASTLRDAAQPADLRTVGQELGARYVMEGSLRQAGNRVRLSVRMVDTSTGVQVWAETYDRPFDPGAAFDVQDDLAPVIVSAVAGAHGALPRTMSQALRGRKPEALAPYEAVLRSFGYLERGTPEELTLARDALQHALAQAPDDADALAMLSFLHGQDYGQGFDLAPDALEVGPAAARRAVELAPSSHLAWRSLAQALFFRREHESFRHAAERAVALNPYDADTLAFMGELLLYAGDPTRGLALSAAAKRLEPNHAGWYWYADAFQAQHDQRDHAAALSYLNRVQLENHYAVHMFKASVHGHLGNREPAARALERLLALRPDAAERTRPQMSRWWSPEQVDHLMDGLRRAGLPIVESGA